MFYYLDVNTLPTRFLFSVLPAAKSLLVIPKHLPRSGWVELRASSFQLKKLSDALKWRSHRNYSQLDCLKLICIQSWIPIWPRSA
jgi:hypothetical protein